MPTFYAIIFLGIATILQTTIASRITLIQGSSDIVLLVFIGWVLHEETLGRWQWALVAGIAIGVGSELPIWLPIIPYLMLGGLITIVKQRIWELPIISLFAAALIGTFLTLIIQWIYLLLLGVPIDLESALNLVILPSIVLNMLLAFPIYALMGEFVTRIYPQLEQP